MYGLTCVISCTSFDYTSIRSQLFSSEGTTDHNQTITLIFSHAKRNNWWAQPAGCPRNQRGCELPHRFLKHPTNYSHQYHIGRKDFWPGGVGCWVSCGSASRKIITRAETRLRLTRMSSFSICSVFEEPADTTGVESGSAAIIDLFAWVCVGIGRVVQVSV